MRTPIVETRTTPRFLMNIEPRGRCAALVRKRNHRVEDLPGPIAAEAIRRTEQ